MVVIRNSKRCYSKIVKIDCNDFLPRGNIFLREHMFLYFTCVFRRWRRRTQRHRGGFFYCCCYYIFFVAASAIVLSLIPLYLPTKGLDGIDTNIGMFYFILLFIWFVLIDFFTGPLVLTLQYKIDYVNNDFSTLSNIVSITHQVGYFSLSISSSYLYISFSWNNNSIFQKLVFSLLTLNHSCKRVVGKEP
jgi:hypothetical protein